MCVSLSAEGNHIKMFMRGRPITMFIPSDVENYDDVRTELPPERLKLEWVYPWMIRWLGSTGLSHPQRTTSLGVYTNCQLRKGGSRDGNTLANQFVALKMTGDSQMLGCLRLEAYVPQTCHFLFTFLTFSSARRLTDQWAILLGKIAFPNSRW